jgi:hypothetical protein
MRSSVSFTSKARLGRYDLRTEGEHDAQKVYSRAQRSEGVEDRCRDTRVHSQRSSEEWMLYHSRCRLKDFGSNRGTPSCRRS